MKTNAMLRQRPARTSRKRTAEMPPAATPRVPQVALAEPPYLPPCLRGRLIGRAESAPVSPAQSCPASRRVVFVEDAADLANAPDCGAGPGDDDDFYFIFRDDVVSPGRWKAHAIVFAVIFYVIAVLGLAVGVRAHVEQLPARGDRLTCAVFVCLLRGTFLAVDPYYSYEIMPPILVGLMWGLVYPLIDLILLLYLWHASEIIVAVKAMKFPDAKVPDALVTAGRVAIVADFAVQIIADSLRSHGIRHTWLVICQVYFVILGALTCVLLLAAAQQLAPGTKLCGRESSPWRAYQRRLRRGLLVVAAFGAFLCVNSIIGLTAHGLSDRAYFAQQTLARTFEALLCLAVIYESAPPYWYAPERAASEASLPQLEALDSLKRQNFESFQDILGRGAGPFGDGAFADEDGEPRSPSIDRITGDTAQTPTARAVGRTDSMEENEAWAREWEGHARNGDLDAFLIETVRPELEEDGGEGLAELRSLKSRRTNSNGSTASALSQRSTFSRAKSTAGELRSEALQVVRQKEELPMRVVPFHRFAAHGRLPRSSDGLARVRDDGDVVVFVSHRWWSEGPDAAVAGVGDVKFRILLRGVDAIVARERCDRGRVCLWMDYACIDQDDETLKRAGVRSLIAWASLSDYLLIPTFPDAESAAALDAAQGPMALHNYGERGWCRLEVYVFLCLSEVYGRHLKCFAYGVSAEKLGARPVDAGVARTGAAARRSCCESLAGPVEALRAFGSEELGAGFTVDLLPSRGALHDETDRNRIVAVEREVGALYGSHTIRVACAKFGGAAPTLALVAKQLTDASVPELVDALSGACERLDGKPAYALDLRANLFSPKGINVFVTLLGLRVAERPSLERLHVLDLGFSRLGGGGGHLLGSALKTASGLATRALFLRGCNLGDAGAHGLLAPLTAAQSDSSHRCRLRALDLADNGIGEAGAVAVSKFLAEHLDVLEDLRLGHNPLGDAGAEAVAAAATNPLGKKRASALRVLGLRACDVGPVGARAVLVAVVAHSLPLQADLADNPDAPTSVLHEIVLHTALVRATRKLSRSNTPPKLMKSPLGYLRTLGPEPRSPNDASSRRSASTTTTSTKPKAVPIDFDPDDPTVDRPGIWARMSSSRLQFLAPTP